ncbi:MAG: T9SS type A sorting domain-containing protein [Bacteroidales bacterium]|nr:T9SS type A sorting domain-containing protein [Bacteroidales bacterium]
MKRLILLSLVLPLAVIVFAQGTTTSKHKASVVKKAVYKPAIHDLGSTAFAQEPNSTVVNPNTSKDEAPVGITNYDLQTNACLSNRLTLFSDGTLAAVFTFGLQETVAMTDRGTGYNYFDGTSWGPAPTVRIEVDRTGWPNHAAFGENGEIIAAHFSEADTAGIIFHKRDNKGTGDWEQIIILPSPDPQYPDALWPRVVTSGPDHGVIHAIYTTYPVANGGGVWQGMDPALLYSRSSDGGTSWDPQSIILDGMTADEYSEIGGDSYAFAEPVGETLAFVVCDTWMTDWFVMKSEDNGDSWDKILIWENPYPFFEWEVTLTTDTLFAPDGSADVAIDQNGMVHSVAGLCGVAHTEVGTSYSYWPYAEGIAYWNEDMGTFEHENGNPHDALRMWENGGEWSANLVEDVSLVGWGQDLDGDDQFVYNNDELYTYRTIGANTMPSITVGPYNQIVVAWAGVNELRFVTDSYNYRSIWMRESHDNGATWSPHFDATADLVHLFDECIYPVVGSNIDGNIHLMYSFDGDIGLALDNDHAYHNNFITYHSELYTSIEEMQAAVPALEISQNYPNPANGSTEVAVNLKQAGNLSLEVTNMAGQVVYTVNKGYAHAGLNKISVNVSDLTPGVYFYTVNAGKETATRKMMVE